MQAAAGKRQGLGQVWMQYLCNTGSRRNKVQRMAPILFRNFSNPSAHKVDYGFSPIQKIGDGRWHQRSQGYCRSAKETDYAPPQATRCEGPCAVSEAPAILLPMIMMAMAFSYQETDRVGEGFWGSSRGWPQRHLASF